MQGWTRARDTTLRAFLFLAAVAYAGGAFADEVLWKRIAQGGVAVMIRHAQTVPGVGDPPGFRLGDCSTQRNLSEEGRAQARRLGAAFEARGIKPARVLSSQWCRCIDTAIAAFGRPAPEPALNSFFDDRKTAPAQSEAVRKLMAAVKPGTLLVLVTHQVNISAIAGEPAGLGEMFVFAPEGKSSARLIGRIPAP
jgi:phosphohistidine phosphatase SixA